MLLAIDQWLDSAPKGQALVYHRGSLMSDRRQDATRSSLTNTIAKAMWQAYKAGDVILVQHKNANGQYDYIAIKRQ